MVVYLSIMWPRDELVTCPRLEKKEPLRQGTWDWLQYHLIVEWIGLLISGWKWAKICFHLRCLFVLLILVDPSPL